MININIKATNIELILQIKEYVNKRISSLEKFLPTDREIDIFVELGKQSNHHQKGPDVYFAEVRMNIPGHEFYSREENADLFTAIDSVRDEVQREITHQKGRRQTMFVRGARSLKKRIKGMKPWWPFGDK